MSCWNREQLEQMLEDVVNELDLSTSAISEHGPIGTPPAQLVRLVLNQKDETIRMLRAEWYMSPNKPILVGVGLTRE